MKLIDEAGSWFRMFSVQALACILAVQGAIAAMPAEMLAAQVPGLGLTWQGLGNWVTVAAALLGGIGRVVQQESVK